MAVISDIKSYDIIDENITTNVGDTNLIIVSTDFHSVETLEVQAPATVEVIDIGVVAPSGGGATNLDDLTDVVITTPSNGQVLKYNGTNWVNDADATGGGAGATNLSSTQSATDVVVVSDTGTDATIPSATLTAAGAMSAADKTKLNGIATGAEVNAVDSVSGRTGDVVLTKTDVGLANVDNTSDASKPVSTAQQAALDGKQGLDSDLTAIASLSPTNDDVLQRKAGAWTNRTPAQVKTDLALTKSDVGLANVDNTSDANKPVSTAQQTALDGKANSSHTHAQADVTGLTTLLALGFYYADGTTSTNARPSVPGKVLWVGGTTQPVNMTTGDLWIKE